MTDYPPPEHLLRDLRFSFAPDDAGASSRAWMPVVAELCTEGGNARAGALATLVDVIGGGLAASAAHPDWIATADLTLHLVAGAPPGSVVEARAQVLRAGRTTVVIEVALLDGPRDLGIATMSFSVLPRRDNNPDTLAIRSSGISTMATEESRLARPLYEALRLEVRDAAAGVIEVPITDWTRNSMGAMQGGVVAMVADAAAETAVRAATGEQLVVTDLHLTYLGFGRVGPVCTAVDLLDGTPTHAAARVEIVDRGAEQRVMTRVSAGRDPGVVTVTGFGTGAGRDIVHYVRAELWESGAAGTGRIQGRADAAPHLRGPHGGVRTGAVLTLLDYAGGFCAGLAALPDGWVVSTNLTARVVEHAHVGPLRIEAEVARRGRNSVVTPVRMTDEGAGDALVADGVLTSAILVPPARAPRWDRPLKIDAQPPPADQPPWNEWLGTRPIDAHTIEIDLDDRLRNPWGILHGGVVASLLDVATEQATGGLTTSVVVHFLAPNRVGPVRATARPLGTRAEGTVCRVELRDEGADRVTAVAVTTACALHSSRV